VTERLPSEQEKRRLEHDAAKVFMRCYEQLTGEPIRHIWHNQPIKPDVSCFLMGERLDIEIAHLYGSEEEAQAILDQGISLNTQHALAEQESIDDINARLLSALNSILKNKSTKHYHSNRVWLVIRNAHPSWDKRQFEQHCASIIVPPDSEFEQIWIVADFSGQSGIVRLA